MREGVPYASDILLRHAMRVNCTCHMKYRRGGGGGGGGGGAPPPPPRVHPCGNTIINIE